MNKIYCLLCLSIFLFIGCSPVKKDGPFDLITIPSQFSKVYFDSDELNKRVSFTAKADWKIALDETTRAIPNWIDVSPMSGGAGDINLSIDLLENKESKSRSADILITSGGVEDKISVSQYAFESVLMLNTNCEEVASAAGSFEVELTSNIDWSTSDIPEWVTLSVNRASGNKSISVSYADNWSDSVRVAKIRFKANSYDKETSLTIVQSEFNPTLTIDCEHKTLSPDAGSFTINLESNMEWNSSGVPEWVTLSVSSASGNKSISVSYADNWSCSERVATIRFKANSYDKETSLTIVQSEFIPTLTIDCEHKTLSPDAGSFTINLKSNVEWNSSGVPEWVTLTPSSGDGSKSVVVSYNANTTNAVRNATITLSNITYNMDTQITLNQKSSQIGDLVDGGSL